jgi:glutathione S-transferase
MPGYGCDGGGIDDECSTLWLWRSVGSFRVRVALRLKGIAFDEISVDILSGGHWTSEGIGRSAATPFAPGPTPGAADICIAGQIVMADAFKVDLTPYPITRELGRRSLALPAFADSRQSASVAPDPA